MRHEFPILEYDAERPAVIDIDLERDRNPDMPRHCVVCFFHDVFDRFLQEGRAEPLTTLRTEMGPHPIYLYHAEPGPVALLHQGMGGPLAAYLLDETIGQGARKFIACGGAGVLDREIEMGQVVVPTSAIRDEGTSYHYLPPAREVSPAATAVAAIEQVLVRHNVQYLKTKAWTTDAIFRETRQRVAARKAEGAMVVEMEAATMFAVAEFRQVELAQILYAGDNLDADEWEFRDWTSQWSMRQKLVELAAEASLSLG